MSWFTKEAVKIEAEKPDLVQSIAEAPVTAVLSVLGVELGSRTTVTFSDGSQETFSSMEEATKAANNR